MADLIAMLGAAAGAAAGGGEVDPNFNQTVLLLHGDGTNGAQNNTFLDSSTNTFTITRNGNTTQGTFSPFSEGWSNYFDGTGDYLQSSSGANTTFDADFTVDCWVYLPSTGVLRPFVTFGDYQSTGFLFYMTSGNALGVYWNNSLIASGGTVLANQWNHCAIVRSGSTITLYLNGTSVATATNSATSGGDTRIGVDYYNSTITHYLTGYISNLRAVKGSAIVPPSGGPTSPNSQSTTNQQLLTCYGNRFADFNTATTAKTITVNGNPSVQPFSPFAPSAAYSPSVNGGSGYFDGTSDYLQAASNVDFQFGTGEFVIEGWYYFTGASADYTPLFSNGRYDNGVMVRFGTNSDLYINGTQTTWTGTTGTFPFNSWNHVCLVRTSTTVSLYVNGTRVLTTTDGANISPTTAFTICDQTHSLGSGFTGYVSNFRTIKGNDGPYDATLTTITVPTTLLTAVSGTKLLLNFTNAGIFDNTGKNNLETVGNAQIDTTTKKYGTGSMKFDGTGDYLTLPASLNLDFSTGNFTVECWFYYATTPPSGSGYDYLWGFGGNNTNGLGLYIQGGVPKIWNGSSILTTTGSIAATTWYHIAVVRSNGTLTVYLNGTSIGSVSLTNNISGGGSVGFSIAKWVGASDPEDFNGFIDDLRITKGVARYTAAFTPPTKAFPDL